MALERTLDKFGQTFSAAYWRVTAATLDPLRQTAEARVHVWATAAARQAGAEPLGYSIYRWTPTAQAGDFGQPATPAFVDWFDVSALSAASSNLYSQIYAYIKTLPEFSGAIDV